MIHIDHALLFPGSSFVSSSIFLFPLAYWILGSGFQVRTDMLGVLIGLMVLVALVGASVGLVLGTAAPIQLLPLIFALVLTPLIFTGCTFYPWASLGAIKWFQVVTLFNPLTYAAEGMRYAIMERSSGPCNTGGTIASESEKDFVQVINRLYHSQIYPSHLVLPVIERDR